MTRFLHPTFDALSAFADAPNRDVSRERVRRHVRECEACRATVAEIRAMGDATRALPLRSAPSDLWAQVAARRADEVEIATAAPTIEGALGPIVRADLPATDRIPVVGVDESRGRATPRTRSIIFGATLVVLGLVASTMLPSRTPLEATGLSRLVVSPARPAPGGALVVRYTPAPYFRREPRLVLIGHIALRGDRRDVVRRLWSFNADSLATLRPQRDGAFVARVTLPADFRWAQLAVVDSTGDRMDRDGRAFWTVVGGNVDRSPSLEALMSAEDNRPSWTGHFDNHLVAGPQWSIADTIQRYFPEHPAGWAYYTHYGTRRGVFDFLRFFETAERKYASYDDALWPERALDADREHAMVVFGRRIEEPLESAKWATRLAREHSDDQRAFDDLFGAIHQMQINSTAGLADSVHAWLPLLIDVSRRGTSSDVGGGWMTDFAAGTPRAEAIALLAREFGDSAMKAAWPSARPANDFVVPGAAPRPMSLAEERQARAQLAESCERPAGRFSLSSGTTSVVQFCELVRSNLLASLSYLEAERGHASLALALADAALHAPRPLWACQSANAHRARAGALLMLGDSGRALQDFAIATGQSLAPPREGESLLAARDPSERARFTAMADSVRHAVQHCMQDGRQRNVAHADSMKLGLR